MKLSPIKRTPKLFYCVALLIKAPFQDLEDFLQNSGSKPLPYIKLTNQIVFLHFKVTTTDHFES